VGSPVVKDVVGDLEEYSENVGYLKEQQHPHSNVVDDFNNEQ